MITVLVTGIGGPAGLATVRSLNLAKKNLKIIGTDIDPLATGRFDVREFYLVPPANDSSYVNTLVQICKMRNVKIIIPTVDEEIYVLSNFLELFSEIGVSIPLPSYNIIQIAKDKSRTMSKMKELGIPTPITYTPKDEKEFFKAIRALGYPCIKKLKTGRGGRGFEIIRNKDDARKIASRTDFKSILLQEFIDGELYLIQLLGDGKGNCLTSITHKRLKTKDEGSGTAVSAITVKDRYIKKFGELLTTKLKWYGVVSPEFMISSKYGHRKPLLIEINPRIAGQSYLSTCAGINLAYYLVLLALGKIRKEKLTIDYELDKTFVRIWKDAVFDKKELQNYTIYKLSNHG